MKFKESDTGSEEHYTRFPGIELDEIGDWIEDRNNIAPCEWSMSNSDYIKWFLSNRPKPVDIRQTTRFWLDRREMMWRRQHPTPGSYEEFLQSSEFGPGEKYAGGYGYIAHPEDTWDQGKLYGMHMIRLQAAIDLRHSTAISTSTFKMEQEIDNHLIATHEPEEEEEATLTAQQKREATLEKVREATAKRTFFLEMARTKTWPRPTPVRTSATGKTRLGLPLPIPSSITRYASSHPDQDVQRNDTKAQGGTAHTKGNHPFRTNRQEQTRNSSRHTEAAQR